MIIEAGFTSEMIALLKEMKGKTFKSYECVDLGNFNTFSSGFRINLGRSSIDVTCGYHALEGNPGGFDEPTWFTCGSEGFDGDLDKYLEEYSRRYMVDEVITGVELVRDRVEYKDDNVVMNMDMALVVRTRYHTYTFARGIWFSDIMSIEVSDAGSEPEGIDSVDNLWVDYDEDAVVARSTIVL